MQRYATSFFLSTFPDDFTAHAVCHFKNTEKSDKFYWILDKLEFNFNTTRLEITLENLFNGDKGLGMFHIEEENFEVCTYGPLLIILTLFF